MNALVERVSLDIMESGFVPMRDENGNERLHNFTVGTMTRQDDKWIVYDL
jgi:hypothetical protein